jgi:hypothetical protein
VSNIAHFFKKTDSLLGCDGGGSTHLWNVGLLLWDYTPLYPRMLPSYTRCLKDMKYHSRDLFDTQF